MLTDAVIHWRGEVVLTRDLDLSSARSEFYSRVKKGEFLAVYRGAYVRAEVWRRLNRDDRYLLRLSASAAIEPGVVFSHHSAAALWRLPTVTGWPRRTHVLQPRMSTDRSTSTFQRHSLGIPSDLVEIAGLTATTLARTVIDVASTAQFGAAVTMADAALRRTAHPILGVPTTSLSKTELLSRLNEIDVRHGSARARRVIEFADASADRPGESMSRVAMHIARVPAPMLQVVLYGASGARYIVDFWWPEFNMIGEFDGWSKYTDPEFLRGRSPEQAFRDEKRREDDLRAAGHGITRWEWEHALSPARLKAKLGGAGVR